MGILLTKSDKSQEVLNELVSFPNVVEASLISGKYSIFCKIQAKDTEDARRVINRIDDISGVLRTETMVSFKECFSDKNRLIKAVSVE